MQLEVHCLQLLLLTARAGFGLLLDAAQMQASRPPLSVPGLQMTMASSRYPLHRSWLVMFRLALLSLPLDSIIVSHRPEDVLHLFLGLQSSSAAHIVDANAMHKDRTNADVQAWTGDSSPLQQALTDHPATNSAVANGTATSKDAPTIVSPPGTVLLALQAHLLRCSCPLHTAELPWSSRQRT